LTYANHQADDLAGRVADWREVFLGPNRDAMLGAARNVLSGMWAGHDGGRGEIELQRDDGSSVSMLYQWVVGRTAGRRDPTRVVVAATDVSRLRSAELALEHQLRQRDQFVATVSHELRTPLTAVMGFTNELAERPGDFAEAERAEMLAMILEQVDDVSSIVEDLLVTARAETGALAVRLEAIDLKEEAARVAEPLGGLSVVGQPAVAHADPQRLRQIIRNLITNAQRYGGDRRRVITSFGNDCAVLEVRDDGPPLSAADRLRIFEPYERSGGAAPVGSVGLGLHVARLLSQLMGGDLTYDHDGTESVFRLELRPAPAHARSAVAG
jgi:signal transduction histidine kinase